MNHRAPILCWLFFLISCGGTSIPPGNEAIAVRFEKMRANLVGRQVTSLAMLIDDPDFHRGKPSLVLLFSGFDCGPCVADGFDLVKKLSGPPTPIFVVGSSVSSGSAQVTYGYENYIYSDDKDAVRKELRFVQTPVVLLLDGDFRIEALYFPIAGADTGLCSDFERQVRSRMTTE